jgi:hypothetical protein
VKQPKATVKADGKPNEILKQEISSTEKEYLEETVE